MSKNIKKILVGIVILLGVVLLAACSSSEPNVSNARADKQEFLIAFNQPPINPQYRAIDEMGEILTEKTDGEYSFDIEPNGLLGDQRQTIELMQAGILEMTVIAGSLLENFNSDFSILNLPYVYESVEHQKNVLNNEEIKNNLFKSLEDYNITVIAGLHGGVRNVYNPSHPIESPEDLNGMQIRTMESDTNIRMIDLMGGVGTTMGQGEVYTAIQSGVLDGAENAELVYNDLSHVEIAPYYSYTQHLMVPDYLLINTNTLNEMTDENREIFLEEINNMVDIEFDLFQEDVERATREAEESGAKFNEVNIDEFRDAVSPLIENRISESDYTQELYDIIQSEK